jgi:hypothetical protein
MTTVAVNSGPLKRPPTEDTPLLLVGETAATGTCFRPELFGTELTFGNRTITPGARSGASPNALLISNPLTLLMPVIMTPFGGETPSGTTGTGDLTGKHPAGTGTPTRAPTGDSGGGTDPLAHNGVDSSSTGTPTSDSGSDSPGTTCGYDPLASKSEPRSTSTQRLETAPYSVEEKDGHGTGSNLKDSVDGDCSRLLDMTSTYILST